MCSKRNENVLDLFGFEVSSSANSPISIKAFRTEELASDFTEQMRRDVVDSCFYYQDVPLVEMEKNTNSEHILKSLYEFHKGKQLH